ncbi:hypothetical protein F4803DRAFT_557014 [Xylaria telfairii]|nr:hypothetical protein F4803DRAFT_557014 [Xylaria telfairii]
MAIPDSECCSADLSWFKLCDGQKLVAELTDPPRVGSAFYLPAKEMCDMCFWLTGLGMETTESKERWVKRLAGGFEKFFGLSSSRPRSPSSMPDDSNTDAGDPNYHKENNLSEEQSGGVKNIDNNPYYAAAKLATEIFHLDLDEETS